MVVEAFIEGLQRVQSLCVGLQKGTALHCGPVGWVPEPYERT